MQQLTFLALAMALVLTALGAESQAKTLKIGCLSPLTGLHAADGADIANGVRAAIAAVQAQGGVPGFDRIELVAEDTACDPRQAAAAANTLVSAGVAGVVGDCCPSSTIAASEVLDQARIPLITPASANADVTERGLRSVFRICGRDEDQAAVAVDFMTAQKVGSVFILDDKTSYAQSLANNVSQRAAAAGVRVLGHERVSQGGQDFSAVLAKVKAANPDVFYFSLQNAAAGALLLIQAKRMGVAAKALSQDALHHPQLVEIAKEAAEGVFLTSGYTDTATPEYAAFEAFYSRLGKAGTYSAYAYDGATALLRAIKAAESADPARVRAALMELDFQGASKKITFLPNGDSGSDYIIYAIKGGAFAPFWNPATGKLF